MSNPFAADHAATLSSDSRGSAAVINPSFTVVTSTRPRLTACMHDSLAEERAATT